MIESAEPATQPKDNASIETARSRPTSFARDVLKLVSGTTAAQSVGILLTPIIARLYAPEAFGVLAVFTSITSIIAVVSCLRFELSIMLPDTDEEAANMFAVSVTAVLAVTALTAVAVTLGRNLLLRLSGVDELRSYLWLIPLVVLIGGIRQALTFWNSRTRQYGRLSLNRIVNAIVISTTKLLAGYSGHATGGSLIGASILGACASAAILSGKIWSESKHLFLSSVNVPAMWSGITKYKKFPLLDVWTGLLNTASWQLPTLLFSSYFSSTQVGYYSLSFRMLSLPMSLIGASIGQVFYQRAAVASSDGELARVVIKTVERLVAVSMFPMLLLSIIGRDLFIFALGARWAEAGVYTQILSIWALFWFISSPISTVFSVLQRQELAIAVQITIFLSRLGSLVIGGVLGDIRLALGLFAGSGVIVYGGLTIWSLILAQAKLSTYFNILLRYLVMSLPLLAILMSLKLAGAPPWLLTIAGVVTLLGSYGLALKTNPDLMNEILPTKRKTQS